MSDLSSLCAPNRTSIGCSNGIRLLRISRGASRRPAGAIRARRAPQNRHDNDRTTGEGLLDAHSHDRHHGRRAGGWCSWSRTRRVIPRSGGDVRHRRHPRRYRRSSVCRRTGQSPLRERRSTPVKTAPEQEYMIAVGIAHRQHAGAADEPAPADVDQPPGRPVNRRDDWGRAHGRGH